MWAVLVLPDGTLVSGESGGHVRFWDGRFGTLLHEFREHLADVLTLAASPAGDTVFAAGVDPRLAVFQRTTASTAGVTGSHTARGLTYLGNLLCWRSEHPHHSSPLVHRVS